MYVCVSVCFTLGWGVVREVGLDMLYHSGVWSIWMSSKFVLQTTICYLISRVHEANLFSMISPFVFHQGKRKFIPTL